MALLRRRRQQSTAQHSNETKLGFSSNHPIVSLEAEVFLRQRQVAPPMRQSCTPIATSSSPFSARAYSTYPVRTRNRSGCDTRMVDWRRIITSNLSRAATPLNQHLKPIEREPSCAAAVRSITQFEGPPAEHNGSVSVYPNTEQTSVHSQRLIQDSRKHSCQGMMAAKPSQ